ncbi:hypothetical protein [Pedobacter sp. Leaf176]|uniref:hypothetical protein n=1 Tax=Pedobacter sp. Leaf176 TaxID=1736286 RepID=UPI0006F95876|nr:hypothetical protein [Pedobacter sp. Leaf176]KQR68376.1 hypothetical protein ASF92_16065 [Pedobacter sp. Leaf176]
MKTRRAWNKQAYQLFIFFRRFYGYEYSFIANVVNREFQTDYHPKRIGDGYIKFLNSKKPVEINLIYDFIF